MKFTEQMNDRQGLPQTKGTLTSAATSCVLRNPITGWKTPVNLGKGTGRLNENAFPSLLSALACLLPSLLPSCLAWSFETSVLSFEKNEPNDSCPSRRVAMNQVRSGHDQCLMNWKVLKRN